LLLAVVVAVVVARESPVVRYALNDSRWVDRSIAAVTGDARYGDARARV